MSAPAYMVPVIVFVLLAGFFAWRLVLIDQGNTPDLVPSVMIGRQAPSFELPLLKAEVKNKTFGSADLNGKVSFINFFASWCLPCLSEHPLIYAALSGQPDLMLVGIQYKDTPEDGLQWLAKHGDPYDVIVRDQSGRQAIEYGVYGVPESFLIDRQGVIRFTKAGPVTPEDIKTWILPMIKKLNNENSG